MVCKDRHAVVIFLDFFSCSGESKGKKKSIFNIFYYAAYLQLDIKYFSLLCHF